MPVRKLACEPAFGLAQGCVTDAKLETQTFVRLQSAFWYSEA